MTTQEIVFTAVPPRHCPACTRQALLVREAGYIYAECLSCHMRGPRVRDEPGESAPARALRMWDGLPRVPLL